MARRITTAATTLLLVILPADAHHSRAAYDMTREIVLEGTVADLAWKNPHIFMTLELADRSTVDVEVTSVSEARALGLPREAVAPGSRVVVRGTPWPRRSAGDGCRTRSTNERRHSISAEHRREACDHAARNRRR
jgi:hypothetical protein